MCLVVLESVFSVSRLLALTAPHQALVGGGIGFCGSFSPSSFVVGEVVSKGVSPVYPLVFRVLSGRSSTSLADSSPGCV